MYVVSKVITYSLIFLFFFNMRSAEADSLVNRCNTSQECLFYLGRNDIHVQPLCKSSNLITVWKKGTSKYLVQCLSGDTDGDNLLWIIDLKYDLIQRLDFGRFVEKSLLLDNKNIIIHDKFSSRNLCNPINASKVKASDFVILDKVPIDGTNPYCYEPSYLAIGRTTLKISTAARSLKLGEADYPVGLVTPQDRSLIHDILNRIPKTN